MMTILLLQAGSTGAVADNSG